MVRFKEIIKKFASQGEKTGWSYIEISAKIAQNLKPQNKKSFRVKGRLDDYCFTGVALLPTGEGQFIMPLNASMRKGIRKQKGDTVNIEMEVDDRPVTLNADLLQGLADEPGAFSFFNTLTPGHKKYFSNWIESAKGESTKATRIAHSITAMLKKQGFPEMLREIKRERSELLENARIILS